jgi:N-acetylneuraminic acid mutarotase
VHWSVVASEPAGREGAGAVTYNGKIYVLGGDRDNGQSTSNPSSSIDIYTP